MTEQKITMTMEQVEQEMEEYRRIFDVVRLIEEETIQMMEEGREEEVDPEKVACYSFWKKNRQCKNCISARVLREKNQGTKLEFAGEDIYQVTACYMEIDGKAYVMELVKKLNEEFLLDAEGCEKLVRKLDGYNQDLYIDALTGSYNRRYYEERLKGKETSAYIDYRERLKNDDMELVFKGQKDLIPRPTDLSYYNWTLQKVMSNDSTFFRVDAGPKERLSFKNNTDRKIINVDLEYLEKHPNSDVRRLPINLKLLKDNKLTITHVDPKKENRRRRMKKDKKDEDDKENETIGYQQIVIFDYETRSK